MFDRETNLHYNYFRDYDPSIGRYIQSDPIGLLGGINTFGYVEGDPMNWVDYFGLQSAQPRLPRRVERHNEHTNNHKEMRRQLGKDVFPDPEEFMKRMLRPKPVRCKTVCPSDVDQCTPQNTKPGLSAMGPNFEMCKQICTEGPWLEPVGERPPILPQFRGPRGPSPSDWD